MGGTLGLRKGILPWALLCATALCAVPAVTRAAAPVVTSGSATVTTTGNTTVIVQTSPKTVYTWQTLNIPAGGLLEFEQQSSSSIALNRVLGGPAIINGSLLSNGQVWIIDPAGVLFGHGASVNVAGLIATTSNISDHNFLNGNFVFDQPTADAKAALVNDGSIAVGAGGAAVLAGAHVVNNGLIEATLGKVVLAAGSAFALDFSGDGLISFAVSAPVNVTPLNANGSAVQSLIANSGTISAAGGEVLLTAQSTRSVLTNVINTTGMIEAVSAHQENGEIVLDAGTGNVTLGPSSVLDASGDQGGGNISVTGGNITVAQGALLDANAVTSGNGGSVSLRASDTLSFNGAISADGGATGGNGGFVDTSGTNLAIASGTVEALAPAGSAGTWLLDPTNVIIATGGTGNPGQAGSFGGSPGLTDTIDPSAIDSARANVVLQATGNVTFANAVTMTNPGIGIEADAGGSIIVNAGASITTSGGSIKFQANSGPFETGKGGIVLDAALSTAGGNAAGGSVSLYVWGGSNSIDIAQNITTAAGAISFNGPTLVQASAVLDSTNGGLAAGGAAITFANAVSAGASSPSLTVDAGTSQIQFDGRPGRTLGTLDLTAASIVLEGGVSSSGGQTYNGAVTLDGNVTLSDSGSGIVFAGTVTGLGDNLTVSRGATTFDGAVTVASLSAGATTLAANITTTAGQSYNGAVTLGANVTLSAGTNIVFKGAVTGPDNSLTVTGGTTTFDAGATLGSLSVQAASLGGSISTAGEQSYGGPVTLLSNTTMSAGILPSEVTSDLDITTSAFNIINFTDGVSGSGRALTVTNGLAEFNGNVTLASLSVQGADLNGSITTNAGQSYGGAVTLTGNTTLSAGGSGIVFGSSVTGVGDSLAITRGNVTFDAGATVGSLSTQAASLDGFFITTGGQIYAGRVTLGGTVFVSDSVSNIVFESSVTGAGDDLNVSGKGVTFDAGATVRSLATQAATLKGTFTTTGDQAYFGPVTLGSNVTLADSGSGIHFDSFVNGAGDKLTITNGTATFDLGATLGSLAIQGAALSGTIATTGSQSYAGPIALLGDATLAASGSGANIVIGGTSNIATGFAFAALAGGNITVAGTLENSGTGAMTLVAGWDGVTSAATAASTAGAFGLNGRSVTIGGAGASGNAGFGSAGGTTTIAAANLTMTGTNGFAQLGYAGGGATGNIAVSLTGNLTMTAGADGDFVQIGHGGAGTSGSESGTISVIAAGTVTMTGGSGTNAYVQIGHGGALTNFGTTVAFGDTGDITLSGTVVSLAAGVGNGAYVQLGNGGLDAGEDASLSSGSIVFNGNIGLTATSNLVMSGNSGTGAYAQIGNGGFGADTHATLLSSGTITESGDIAITTGSAASAGSIVISGDAYAQIGNGGYDGNGGASAGGINEGGNITMSLNGGTGTINAGDQGSFAYGQVGNGDASHTGEGNVSGNIDVSSSGPWTLNGSGSASAWMWNATGSGSVTGGTQIDGAAFPPPSVVPPPPPGPDLSDVGGLNGVLTSNDQPPPNSSDNPGPSSNLGSTGTPGDLGQNLNAIAPTAGSSSGAGAIEQMTDSSGGGAASGEAPAGAGQEADELSNAVALSLTKASVPGGTQVASCIRTSSGTAILCELAPDAGAGKTPVGVQPADQPYSSWGNESLWQQ